MQQSDKGKESSLSRELQEMKNQKENTTARLTDYKHPYLGKQIDFTR